MSGHQTHVVHGPSVPSHWDVLPKHIRDREPNEIETSVNAEGASILKTFTEAFKNPQKPLKPVTTTHVLPYGTRKENPHFMAVYLVPFLTSVFDAWLEMCGQDKSRMTMQVNPDIVSMQMTTGRALQHRYAVVIRWTNSPIKQDSLTLSMMEITGDFTNAHLLVGEEEFLSESTTGPLNRRTERKSKVADSVKFIGEKRAAARKMAKAVRTHLSKGGIRGGVESPLHFEGSCSSECDEEDENVQTKYLY